jgi:hypothetical protein
MKPLWPNGICTRHLSAATEEYPKKSVAIAGAPADTRTEHLLNASLERNRCPNLLVRSLNCLMFVMFIVALEDDDALVVSYMYEYAHIVFNAGNCEQMGLTENLLSAEYSGRKPVCSVEGSEMCGSDLLGCSI